MIHVRRRSWEPPVLTSRYARAEQRRLKAFFTKSKAKGAPRRYDFREELWQKSADTLYRVFHGRCAYCETHFDRNAPLLVDHFRPLARAKNIDGKSSALHYWWLAYEWSNLYPICAACQKAKGTKFPVGHARAAPESIGEALAAEGALLLDPCLDYPEVWLRFDEGGYVKARPLKGAGKNGRNVRAEVTIETFALNRKALVEAREAAMFEVTAAVKALGVARGGMLVAGIGADRSHPVRRIKDLLHPKSSHLGARREAVRLALQRLGGFGQLLINQLPQLAIGKTVKKTVAYRPRDSHRRTTYVSALSIRNFKGISELDLTFGKPPGWKVLLGENGTGKSSVLQALALALAGSYEAHRHLMINPDKILRRARGRLPRPKDGFVLVTLSTGDEIEIRFSNAVSTFEQGPRGAETFLRAYGPTRNLPVTRAPASWKSVDAMVRIINLFDTNSPLCSAERWLAGLKPPARFEAAGRTLKALLRLDRLDNFRLESRYNPFTRKRARCVVVDVGNATVSLDELSDGYQSMIALAVDIMAGLPKTSTDFQSDTGIVLIDELGNHLHPRWRMEVVSSLKRAFPGLQFIATTHEPLCLRGLEQGQIVVMRREDRTLHVETDLPSPAQMRVDQLLTSRFFGLYSTIDPDTEQKFTRYYALLAKDHRTDAEESERRTLSLELTGEGVLGNTRRDQLVYEVIDEFIAHEPKLADTAGKLKEKTKLKVLERWNNLSTMVEAPR
jgi:uncharacterized protein (TIGR02646 family)